jgi:hypothetical protein
MATKETTKKAPVKKAPKAAKAKSNPDVISKLRIRVRAYEYKILDVLYRYST